MRRQGSLASRTWCLQLSISRSFIFTFKPGEKMTGSVFAGQEKVVLRGKNRGDGRGQHQIPNHTGVGVGGFVGGDFVQGTIGSVR